ncbi:MAG: hypothetical protein CMG71_02560 [Candidatus Marinimicrobia bacterium]|nr:hypothetical protein [Candidatus Neomarinimicrobiota bacterium]
MSKLFLILSFVFFIMWIITSLGVNWPSLGKLGHLPGDYHFTREDFSFHLPLGSSILLSIVLNVILRFFSKV